MTSPTSPFPPSVTVDPRLHDAVIVLVPPDGAMAELIERLHEAGVATDHIVHAGDSDPVVLRVAAQRLGTRAERSVVVVDTAEGVAAARDGGFALVIALAATADSSAALLDSGADAAVNSAAAVAVRTGDRRMSDIPDALESYRSIAETVGSRVPAVCLDYDGTLSPIVDDPAAARLVDGAADTLARLAAQCPVAILSGRDLADIRERVAVPGLWYAGSHGFESVAPDGTYHCNDEAAAAVPVLERAAAELRNELAHVRGIRVEHKRFAVAVHYRDVDADGIGQVAARTHRIGRSARLRVTNGRKVVELRPDVDWDKGTTLAWIRHQIEDGRPVVPIYLGDDLTDEDAFDAVRVDGIGILVRHNEDGDRRSSAAFTVDGPDRAHAFLDRLADGLAGPLADRRR